MDGSYRERGVAEIRDLQRPLSGLTGRDRAKVEVPAQRDDPGQQFAHAGDRGLAVTAGLVRRPFDGAAVLPAGRGLEGHVDGLRAGRGDLAASPIAGKARRVGDPVACRWRLG